MATFCSRDALTRPIRHKLCARHGGILRMFIYLYSLQAPHRKEEKVFFLLFLALLCSVCVKFPRTQTHAQHTNMFERIRLNRSGMAIVACVPMSMEA